MSWLSEIGGLFTGSGMRQAEQDRQNQLAQYYGQFQDLTNANLAQINQNYMAALEPFKEMASGATAGTNAYLDASGANGPEGLERARAQYMMSPGTRSAIDEAVRNVGRTGVAGGGASGNIMQAAVDRSSDLAMRDYYGNYLGGLAPLLGYGLNVAGARSGVHTGLAGALSQAYGVAGQGALGQGTAMGQSAYNQGMAGTMGAANLVNLLQNIGGIFAGGLGGGMSSLGSGIFSKYSGNLMGQGSRGLVGGY